MLFYRLSGEVSCRYCSFKCFETNVKIRFKTTFFKGFFSGLIVKHGLLMKWLSYQLVTLEWGVRFS